ncbi:preprotein translocase subunit SecG [Helicobacter cholecystus]|uniref:Protein-export membrane protein SecG n=1 Tax=Helicobacter cholecystus TaxID=45498 RepID=A0A3D8IWL8_9HELI|nr:preprotein translocase subunit SecG [Helicobacter cholecystus]RDU69433.1 preprotein translocase subunit SecG [Helicobacter cholecystus]VEJ23981.1 preprotein translocase subunit [Helicobacter cholecystus]
MISVLFVVQIILAVFITLLVLLQKSSSGGLVNYSGSNESVFGAKGANGFLLKVTLFFGALFLANTIALSYLYIKETQQSIMSDLPTSSPIQAPQAPSIPSAPTIPTQKAK